MGQIITNNRCFLLSQVAMTSQPTTDPWSSVLEERLSSCPFPPHQSEQSTESPKPGVSTKVNFTLIPPSSISTPLRSMVRVCAVRAKGTEKLVHRALKQGSFPGATAAPMCFQERKQTQKKPRGHQSPQIERKRILPDDTGRGQDHHRRKTGTAVGLGSMQGWRRGVDLPLASGTCRSS